LEAHDFRFCFTPLAGVLFTVPSRYYALSVAACSLPWTVVCPASAQVLRAWTYSGTSRRTVSGGYATITRYGAAFQTASPPTRGSTGGHQSPVQRPPTPGRQRLAPWHRPGLGVDPVRSPLLRVWFSLPPATEMFQLAGYPPRNAVPAGAGGLPHSEISGSQPASGSPEHFGAKPRPSSARSARASIVCSSCLPSAPACGTLRHPPATEFPVSSSNASVGKVRRTAPSLSHECVCLQSVGLGWCLAAQLPRKEVIQPHLPVRLPCYDFVPVATPALGRCLPKVSARTSSIGHSHDVTGGVYKARERIHRAMADTRLLATPPSRGRVAAPDLHWDQVWRLAPACAVATHCPGHCSVCVAPGVRAMLT
jgi:hypothetical protein